MHTTFEKSSGAAAMTPPGPSSDPPVSLPNELVEIVLMLVPLRFPLDQIHGLSSDEMTAKAMHDDCAAALAVLPLPPRSTRRLFAPRLADGCSKMMSSTSLFSTVYLHYLFFKRGLQVPLAHAVAGALRHNRADVLEWLSRTFPTPWTNNVRFQRDKHPIRCAVTAGAWDALDWVTRDRQHCRRSICEDALGADDLAELVKSGGSRQLRFVSLWLDAGLAAKNDDFEDMLRRHVRSGPFKC